MVSLLTTLVCLSQSLLCSLFAELSFTLTQRFHFLPSWSSFHPNRELGATPAQIRISLPMSTPTLSSTQQYLEDELRLQGGEFPANMADAILCPVSFIFSIHIRGHSGTQQAHENHLGIREKREERRPEAIRTPLNIHTEQLRIKHREDRTLDWGKCLCNCEK